MRRRGANLWDAGLRRGSAKAQPAAVNAANSFSTSGSAVFGKSKQIALPTRTCCRGASIVKVVGNARTAPRWKESKPTERHTTWGYRPPGLTCSMGCITNSTLDRTPAHRSPSPG